MSEVGLIGGGLEKIVAVEAFEAVGEVALTAAFSAALRDKDGYPNARSELKLSIWLTNARTSETESSLSVRTIPSTPGSSVFDCVRISSAGESHNR